MWIQSGPKRTKSITGTTRTKAAVVRIKPTAASIPYPAKQTALPQSDRTAMTCQVFWRKSYSATLATSVSEDESTSTVAATPFHAFVSQRMVFPSTLAVRI